MTAAVREEEGETLIFYRISSSDDGESWLKEAMGVKTCGQGVCKEILRYRRNLPSGSDDHRRTAFRGLAYVFAKPDPADLVLPVF